MLVVKPSHWGGFPRKTSLDPKDPDLINMQAVLKGPQQPVEKGGELDPSLQSLQRSGPFGPLGDYCIKSP